MIKINILLLKKSKSEKSKLSIKIKNFIKEGRTMRKFAVETFQENSKKYF